MDLISEALLERFLVTSGSVPGREHVRLNRSNQDGLAIRASASLLVGVVTDGCSEGRASGVGAGLAAEWLAGNAARYWPLQRSGAEAYASAMARGLVSFLSRVLAEIDRGGERRREIVRDALLFTVLAAVVGPRRAIVFGAGDGVVSVNGRTRVLDSGPDNAPSYLGYRLLASREHRADPAALSAKVLHDGPTAELETLLIASDGAAPLAARAAEGCLEDLAKDLRYAENPSLLHKRLVQLSSVPGLLSDDTTVLLAQRRRPS